MAGKHEESAPEVRATPDPRARDNLEYRAALDQTLPPTPLKDLIAAGGATVFVLSTDRDLIDTVQRAGGEQFPVFDVADWDALVGAIDSGRCGIALLDAGSLGDKLERRIALLSRYADRVVTLVAADREVAQGLIGLLSERKIHRLLIKPPAFGITRLLLESAVGRCLQLRETAKLTAPRHDGPAQRRKGAPAWVVGIAVGALVVGLVGVGALVHLRKQSSSNTGRAAASVKTPDGPAAAASPLETVARAESANSSAPKAAPDRFAELMRRADDAFTQGRLAEPVGDNALDYYLTILAADPSHKAARDRLAVVIEALFTQAEAALLGNSLDAAGTILEQVRRADAGSSRLAFLDTQLERARAEAAAAAAAETTRRQIATTVQPNESAPQRVTKSAPAATLAPAPASTPPAVSAAAAAASSPPSELDSLLSIEEARLSKGQLLEPAGDSALEYLKRATRLAKDDERVRTAATRLGEALLSAAHAALDDARFDAADRSIIEARPLLGESADLVALEQNVRAARDAAVDRKRAAMLAAARDRLRTGALVEPADDSALYYLSSLLADGYAAADVDGVRSDLAKALSTVVRSALDKSDWPAADRALAALHRVDPDSAATRALDRRLEIGRLQQQYLATAVPASELKVLSYKTPVYPADALARGLEGWVELEYVVDRSGRTKDVSVVAADPPGRFDKPAIAAIRQYEYEPFQRDGQVYERRVRFRMKFALR